MLHFFATLVNLALLVLVYVRARPLLRWIQTASCAFIVAQNLIFYGLVSASPRFTWTFFDFVNVCANLAFSAAIMDESVGLASGLFVWVIVVCVEYALADEGLFDVANFIYQARSIADIILGAILAYMIYSGRVGNSHKGDANARAEVQRRWFVPLRCRALFRVR